MPSVCPTFLTINSDNSLNSNSRLVFVLETQCVFYKVGIEYLDKF